jgi:hypothetical protein
MPIAAVPVGVEIRKITPTQKKALDELLKKQKDSDLQIELLKILIPTVAFVGVSAAAGAATFAYLKDVEIPSGAELVKSAGSAISDVIVSGIDAAIGEAQPSTPEYLPSGRGPLTRCVRWETDYVDLQGAIQAGEADSRGGTVIAALLLKRIIKQMKKEGCTRPVTIPQSQWDEV